MGWYEEPATGEEAEAQRRDQIDRMLLVFKQSLPAHDVHDVVIAVESHPRTVVDERARALGNSSRVGIGHATGTASCSRCGRRFRFPNEMHRNQVWVKDEDAIPEAGAVVRRELLNLAAKAGECWGAVPEIQVRGFRVWTN